MPGNIAKMVLPHIRSLEEDELPCSDLIMCCLFPLPISPLFKHHSAYLSEAVKNQFYIGKFWFLGRAVFVMLNLPPGLACD